MNRAKKVVLKNGMYNTTFLVWNEFSAKKKSATKIFRSILLIFWLEAVHSVLENHDSSIDSEKCQFRIFIALIHMDGIRSDVQFPHISPFDHLYYLHALQIPALLLVRIDLFSVNFLDVFHFNRQFGVQWHIAIFSFSHHKSFCILCIVCIFHHETFAFVWFLTFGRLFFSLSLSNWFIGSLHCL